jgi:hypothetical protein
MSSTPVAPGLGWPGSDGVPSGGLGWPAPSILDPRQMPAVPEAPSEETP